MKLVSDVRWELESGEMVELPPGFQLPLGMPGIGSGDDGRRAPDSNVVVRNGDLYGTAYTITGTGRVNVRAPGDMQPALELLWRQGRQTRRVWRAERCYIHVAYVLLPSPDMGAGWLSAGLSPIYRLSKLGWWKPVYNASGAQVGEEETYG